jgi:signal transduction histidine kinase
LQPSAFSDWSRFIGLLPVVIGFFAVGADLALRHPRYLENHIQARWVSAFLILTALALAFGAQASRGPLWTLQLYVVFSWAGGVAALGAHLLFPRVLLGSNHRVVISVFVILASLGLAINFGLPPVQVGPMSDLGRTFGRLWTTLAVLVPIAFLILGLVKSTNLAERRQAGIVAAGGIAGIVPFALLALSPWLAGRFDGYYQLEFLPLLLIPAAYGYALLRFRQLAQDRWVPRLVNVILSGTLITGAGLLSIRLLSQMDFSAEPLAGAVAVVVALTTLICRLVVRRGLDWLLYRRWYDPLTIIAEVVGRLDLHADELNVPGQVQTLIARELNMPSQVLTRHGRVLSGALGTISLSSPLVTALTTAGRMLERDELARIPGLTTEDMQLLTPAWVQAAIALPSRVGIAGILVLGHKTTAPFMDPADLTILKVLSTVAGQVLENAISFRKLQEAPRLIARARADERNYLARSLHDDHIQLLNPFIWQLGMLRGRTPTDAEIEALRQQISDHMQGLRQVCAHLRANTLDSLGLEAAVQILTDEAAATGGFQAKFDYQNEDLVVVPVAVAESAVGVAREALANTVKHAGARMTTVTVKVRRDQVEVIIADDGRGFDPEAVKDWALQNNHFGLVGLQEQALLVDGTLTLESEIGRGTRVQAILPIGDHTSSASETQPTL